MPLPGLGRWTRHWASQAEPRTAWQQAEGIWQRYRRDPDVRAQWWKLVALLSVIALSLHSLHDLHVAHRPTVEPYYVYVTPAGDVLGVEKIAAKPYDQEQELLRRLAQEWLEQVRGIPLDAVVLNANWKKAIAMSTPPVAQRLYAYAKLIDLTTLAKKAQERELAVKVVPESVLSVSARVIKITWHETLYDGANVERETVRYSGEFEFIVQKPTTREALDANPLGVWMARFTWAKHQT